MIAIGDTQLGLAATIAALSTTRWSLRGPLVLLLVFSGSVIHYVALVFLAYPFIFAEEYSVPLLLATSNFIALWRFKQWRRTTLSDQDLHGPHSMRYSLGDLFAWVVVSALLITIGLRVSDLTDQSGMNDPWESIQFASTGAPTWVLWRLPLLLAALILHAVAWTYLVQSVLGAATTWKSIALAIPVVVSLSLGELVVGSGALFFDPQWPLLPVSMLLTARLADRIGLAWEGISELSTSPHITDVSMILGVRVGAVGGSLYLLRTAGMRMCSR